MADNREPFDVQCRQCHMIRTVQISREDFSQWQDGVLIQNAMPYLTPGERELLISRICEPCFDKMFADK